MKLFPEKFQNSEIFYEELEDCINELNKIIRIVNILLIDKDTKNKITIRNFKIINFNFNFLLEILNLFKFDINNKIRNKMIEISILKLYIYTVEEFKKLKIIESHFYYFSDDEKKRYLETIRILLDEIKTKNHLNLTYSKIGFLYLRYVRFYIFKINKYIFKNENEKMRNKLSFYNAKFNFLCYLSTCCLISNKDNLFEENKNSVRWQNIKSVCDFTLVDSFSTGERKKKYVHWFMNYIQALLYSIDYPNFTKSFINIVKLLIYTIYYAIIGKSGKSERIKNITKPRLEITKLIFETYEFSLVNIIYTILRKKTYHNIRFHLKLNRNKLSILKGNLDNKNKDNIFNYRIITDIKEFQFSEKIIKINNDSNLFNIYEILKNSLINKIYLKNINVEYDVIFYIHGGGFFSQTTESALGFLSDIAKDIPNCLIFSFDYKLANSSTKIEDMITECQKAYTLLITNIEKLLKFKIRRIIISGDSAGGFLGLNIMNFITRQNLRKPDGLILLYPCTRVYFKEMLPSSFFALTDPMIDTPFLSNLMNITIDVESYYKRNLILDERHNFNLTPDEIVKQFPNIFIFVGTNDPIRDECYRLVDFLLKNSVKVEMKEYLYFPHGFMSMTTFVDKYYIKGLEDVKSCMKKIFDKK